ncbi:MAG: M23 family metallopeptidase [Paludibacteraceae bacterium]|jgi:murein DD-endopeptidase MepM/ murein hydrolase activator NlpD|nr:M23 family metallopeptidase [Paludibacteraceae bacterium]MEE0951354.1 M23 family metallopeptidase [Paludibacteraceae bacterium]MEE1068885.1 M23 family metallopeptidase [Paludibacteraceae bacterium]MEE1253762.1 M23 family metallopeptidase [Paludibacteraceae bacterium]
MKKPNRRRHYRINPETLQLEHIEHGFRYWLRRSGGYILGGICIGILFFYVFLYFFPSPREAALIQYNKNLTAQLELMNKQVDQMQVVMSDMAQRDDNLYRAILGAEPIPLSTRLGATQQVSYYDSIARMTNVQLASEVQRKVDILEKEMYVQARSYEEIVELAKNQEVRMENIPAIQPVLNKDLKRMASGYGWRVDPVYHIRRFHEGMDFSAPIGTEIFATGNSTVIFAGWKQGYGQTVDLDHGFGYSTRYAHCSKLLVRPGQKVKRGDVIALVGNTGKSVGPHLHYEVHYQGRPVDPRNFYFYDLSPEDYDKMVQLSSNMGNMLD